MQIIAAMGLVALLAGQQTPSSASVQQLTKQFQALETTLMGASQNKQTDVKERLLAPDFAYSVSFRGQRNQVMSRSEWIQGVKHYDISHFQIAMLTAQKLDNNVIVQFRVTAEAGSANVDLSGEYVMTDVWRAKGSTWQLARRWVSSAVPMPKAR